MSLLNNFVNPWEAATGVLDTGVLETGVLDGNVLEKISFETLMPISDFDVKAEVSKYLKSESVINVYTIIWKQKKRYVEQLEERLSPYQERLKLLEFEVDRIPRNDRKKNSQYNELTSSIKALKKEMKPLEEKLDEAQSTFSTIDFLYQKVEKNLELFINAIGEEEYQYFRAAKNKEGQMIGIFIMATTNETIEGEGNGNVKACTIYRFEELRENPGKWIGPTVGILDYKKLGVTKFSDKDGFIIPKENWSGVVIILGSDSGLKEVANEFGDVIFGLERPETAREQTNLPYLEKSTTKYSFAYDAYVVKKNKGENVQKPNVNDY